MFDFDDMMERLLKFVPDEVKQEIEAEEDQKVTAADLGTNRKAVLESLLGVAEQHVTFLVRSCLVVFRHF
jgi:hypothetical protein